MKNNILILLAFFTFTSCLKTDVFDKKLEDHFQYSDFYLNDFENFSMDTVFFSTSSSQLQTGIRYFGEAHFQMNQEYYDLLMQNFDGQIKVNDKVISRDSNQVFKSYYGPFENSTTLTFDFELVLTNVREMGRTNFRKLSLTIP